MQNHDITSKRASAIWEYSACTIKYGPCHGSKITSNNWHCAFYAFYAWCMHCTSHLRSLCAHAHAFLSARECMHLCMPKGFFLCKEWRQGGRGFVETIFALKLDVKCQIIAGFSCLLVSDALSWSSRWTYFPVFHAFMHKAWVAQACLDMFHSKDSHEHASQ